MKVLVLTIITTFLFAALLPGADCPAANVITKMNSAMDSFKAALPLDFSRITSAGVVWKRNGTEVEVLLSNGDFTTRQMANEFEPTVKKNGEFIVVIHFANNGKKITAGAYRAGSDHKSPFWVYVELKLYNVSENKGKIISLGVREGTAEIFQLTDKKVCGKFQLQTGKNSRQPGEIAGEFNVSLEEFNR
jgi:hypothetical protein